MSAQCEPAAQGVGNGVAAALRAVDCVAGETTSAAFGRLFAPGGSLTAALTILLTLFIASFAFALLMGRTNLSLKALLPRIITLGSVITFATSWVAFHTLVWNLTLGAPDQLASIVTGSQGSATDVFAQKIDVVFQALQQASPGQAQGKDISAFSPEGMMWLGAMLLLLGTVGVLVTARIALAVLIAVGPVFVVMALFGGTRGLFTGWLKGLVMLALVPLFAVLGGSVMLELAVPVLAALVQTPGQIDSQAAMAFLMIGAVHVALMIMVLKVAGTMVSGWRVFGLVPDRHQNAQKAWVEAVQIAHHTARSATDTQPASSPDRSLRAIPFMAPPANDRDSIMRAGHDVRILRITPTADGAPRAPAGPGPIARARGIGSRFRAPEPRIWEKRG